MEDIKGKLEKLLTEAAECDMIGNLATDKAKRDLFRKLAADLRAMADDLQAIVASGFKPTDDEA